MSDRPPPKKSTAMRPAVDPAALEASGSGRLPRPDRTPSESSGRLPRQAPGGGRLPDTQGDSRGDSKGGGPKADPGVLVGRTLGPCQLLEVIGEGGLGRVYRARHLRLEHDVAVKVIGRTKPEALARFRREAQIAARLTHPNVARVLDTDAQDGVHYIIQELVPGTSVEERVRRGGPLALHEVVAVGLGLASGLDSIHKAGVVHRDLKPANVILTPEGAPKLLDFGIAKDLGEEAGFTDDKSMLGTPTFLAPEQVSGNARVGPASDLYGLGGTLFFALTGRAPLEPHEDDTLLRYLNRRAKETPPAVATLRKDAPAPLSALVAELLAIEPDDRPTAARTRERLEAIERALPPKAAAPQRGASERTLAQRGSSERLQALGKTPSGSQAVSRGASDRLAAQKPPAGSQAVARGASDRLAAQKTPADAPRRGASERAPAVSTSMPTPSSPPRTGGIQGALEDMPLTELLQGVEFNQKTGVLELDAGGGMVGTIEFQEGNPWDARTRDGKTGEEAMRLLVRAKSGAFALRSADPRPGTRRVKVSFTRLLLDASRVDDESGRQQVVEAPTPTPPPPPPAPEEKDDLSESSSALQSMRRLYSTDEVENALEALEAEAHAAGDPVGDPFLGCTIGAFEVQKLLGVFAGERRYLAWDTASEARCLLRVFPFFGPQEEEFRRLAKRAELAVGIEHPSLLRCLGSGRTRDAFFCAFEPPVGVTLEALVAQGGPQTAARTLEIVEGAARALKALHRRDQVHGHLSPATIRVDAGGAVVVTEAGLGRPHPTFAFLSAEGAEVLAPPGFAAPETLDLSMAGPAADIYALGCVAWTLLMGRPPAKADEDPHLLLERVHGGVSAPRAQKGPALPEGLVTLVGKMTGTDPKVRYRSVNDLLADLRACRDGGAVAAFAPSQAPAARGPRVPLLRRHPRLVLGALLTGVAGLAVAVGMTVARARRVDVDAVPFQGVRFPAPR